MSLFGFVSDVEGDVFFNPRIFGLPACYIRISTDDDGNETTQHKKLLVMLQRSYQAHDEGDVEIGARTTFIWVRTKDMIWDNDEVIIPKYGDEVAVDVRKQLHVYRVSTKGGLRMPTQFGGLSTFGHEDGEKKIMTIQVIRIK